MTERPTDYPPADGKRGIDFPQSAVCDLGVIELAPQETEEESFYMPFNGFIQRVGVSWPSWSNNSIGVNLAAKPGLLDPSTDQGATDTVTDLDTFFPKNHPNPEFVTDDNQYIPFRPIEYIPARAEVEAEIKNGSVTSALDLQVRVTVTDFDPRATESFQQQPNQRRR